jgi:sialic acid synthase SpsE
LIIIAEIGANHHQDFETAKALVRAAKGAGADAVKVQLFTPDQMTLDSDDERFQVKEGPWKGKLYDLYKKAAMPLEWTEKLQELATSLGLLFVASVYHPDMVGKYDIPIYKIASFEINYKDLIKKVAKTKKPVIISTGMAEFSEIKSAVNTVKQYHKKLTLLRCVSQYPAELADMHLETIPALAHRFKTKVGLSDHTTGVIAPIVAATLGATVIEKHLTLDGEGLDKDFSIFPERFRVMVETVKGAMRSLGEVTYGGEKRFRREWIGGKFMRTGEEECLMRKQSLLPEGQVPLENG